MASKESSPEFHFRTLLNKKQLVPGQSFKSVALHPVDFSTDGLTTDKFINKVTELSQCASVQQSGGFIVLRPKQGVSVFTKPRNDQTNPSLSGKSTSESVWDAIPSLKSAKSHEVLYSTQKAAEWKVPLFGWNKDHKEAVIEQNEIRSKNPPLPQHLNGLNPNGSNGANPVFRSTSDPFILGANGNINGTNPYPPDTPDDDTKCPEPSLSSNGRKRKNELMMDDVDGPRKRQKIESQHPTSLLSYHNGSTPMSQSMQCESTNTFDTNTTHSSNASIAPNSPDLGSFRTFTVGEIDHRLYDYRDLEFYRGFCCMATTKPDYKRCDLLKYITSIERETADHITDLSGRGSVEDKYLSFIKFFYNGHCADYGHVEAGDTVSCYDTDSPFKAGDLRQYGPFSCLNEEEQTKGVHSPYIYIGKSHTFFPWHNGMELQSLSLCFFVFCGQYVPIMWWHCVHSMSTHRYSVSDGFSTRYAIRNESNSRNLYFVHFVHFQFQNDNAKSPDTKNFNILSMS